MDGETLVLADAQQLAGARERIEHRARFRTRRGITFLGDEASADRVIDALIERLSVGAKGREPHAVRVAWE